MRRGIGIGGRLAKARKLGGMSRRGLSLLAGLAQAVVGMIERDPDPQPTADTLLKLSETLGISLDWLVADKGRAPTRAQVRAAVTAARAAAPVTVDKAA